MDNKTRLRHRKEIIEHIDELLSKPIEQQGNMALIREEIKNYGGKVCDFHGAHCGYVIGAVSDYFDYYWCYLDENCKLHFSTCCGNPTNIDCIPEEYEELVGSLNRTPDVIKDWIKNKIKTEYEDVFFTDVYIGTKIYNRKEFL